MGRPATHRINKPHAHARYRDKIRMLNYRRGPNDDIWAATFAIESNGKIKWTPRDGISLGTREFDEACERARDKYPIMLEGHRTARPYKQTKRSPLRLHIWAAKAVKRLRKEAAEQNAVVPGKGRAALNKVWRIERFFARTDEQDNVSGRWANHPLDEITADQFTDWVTDELMVKDLKNGGMKRPTKGTIGKIDDSFAEIWREAVAAKMISPKIKRPSLPKKLGEKNAKGAHINREGVQAVANVMTDEWIESTDDRFEPDKKRMFRAYVAMLATTGLRTGAEAMRMLIGFVQFAEDGTTINFTVRDRQGKYEKGRQVPAFIKDGIFNVGKLLKEHIAWRETQGASGGDEMFVNPDGSYPEFYDLANKVLDMAGQTYHPITKRKRTLYSFRHFYATRMIHAGVSDVQLAYLMGTSTHEIREHYSEFFSEYNAAHYTGAKLLA